MEDGRLLVFSRYAVGLGDFDNTPNDKNKTARADDVTAVPFDEAFERRWDFDAHFVGYWLDSCAEIPSPFRLKKEILPDVRRVGGEILLQVIGIDFDWCREKPLPGQGHPAWTQEAWRSFNDQLAVAESRGDAFSLRLRSAAHAYATKGGYRWVFRLRKPVPVDAGEDVMRGLVAEFHAAGFPVDELSDWTRLFRLPRVLRENTSERSEDAWWFDSVAHPGALLDESTVARIPYASRSGKRGGSSPTVRVEEDQPDDDEAEKILHAINTNGNKVETSFYKNAKKILNNRNCWDFCFRFDKAPDYGPSRHKSIMSWVAEAGAILAANLDGMTAARLYALFFPQTQQVEAEDDDGERQWLRTLWRQVKWVWERELGGIEQRKKEAEQKKQEVEKERAAAALISDDLTGRVRAWPSRPSLPGDAGEAWKWISRRMIVRFQREHYVMTPKGHYARLSVDKDGIVAQVVAQGMDGVIEIHVETRMGEERMKTYAEMSRDYITPVRRVVARPEIEGGYLEGDDPENPTLVQRSFRRRKDLTPLFSADVDLWLRALGGEKFEILCKQIGMFLAFDKGACPAMSWVVVPGSGKKMIVQGFLECMEEPEIATVRDLIDSFNAGLRKSPFLLVNEGFPTVRGYSHPSDMFRALVSGDLVAVNEKHKSIVTVRNPMRVIFTANNEDAALTLTEGRDLAPADQLALAERLIAYAPGTAARDLLRAKGDMAWTKGWIAGDADQPSNYVVARHFLWLWEKYGKNAEPSAKHGFLMDGDGEDSVLIRRMRTTGGSIPVVLEVVAKALDHSVYGNKGFGPGGRKHGFWVVTERDVEENAKISDVEKRTRLEWIRPGMLLVTASGILDFWRENLTKGTADRLSSFKIQKALKSLVTQARRGKWHEIDVKLLRDAAEEKGWTIETLEPEHLAKVAKASGR